MRLDLMLALLAFAVFGVAGLLQAVGPEPESCETYREMRATYEQSNGEFGWPEGAQGGCEDE